MDPHLAEGGFAAQLAASAGRLQPLAHAARHPVLRAILAVPPKAHDALALVGAAAIEIAWEMMENSPVVINRYRTATMALGYEGDSILNSMGDVLSFVIGFYVARRAGLWWSIAIFLAVDLSMLWWIRDNLALNVLMLLWPIDAIRKWQAGG
jgi:hypothetical protein